MVYLTGIMDVIFSKDVISKVIDDGMISDVVQICLFEDGNLAKLFVKDKQSTKVLGYFDKLYKSSNTLITTSDRIKFSENSFTVNLLTEILKKRESDLSQSVLINYDTNSTFTVDYDTEGEYVVAQLNKFVNEDLDETKQEKCDSYSKDFFINKNEECPSNYDVILNSTPTSKVGQKNCLLVFQWDQEKITARYESRPKGCQLANYRSVQEAAVAHIVSLTKYYSECNLAIPKVSEDINR